MNTLLLEPPIYISRLFINLAGNLEAGVALDYLMKKFKHSNSLVIHFNDFLKDLAYTPKDVIGANKRLSHLPFIKIEHTGDFSFTYTLMVDSYEKYLLESNLKDAV